MCVAAYKGHLEFVRYLAESGADKDQGMNDDATPMFVSAENGHADVVRYLTEAGARKDQSNKAGATPMRIATQNGHLEVVRCLTEVGANKDLANNHGTTPMQIPAQKGHLDVVHFLGAGARKDGQNTGTSPMTPTHVGTQSGYVHVASQLAEIGSREDRGDDKVVNQM